MARKITLKNKNGVVLCPHTAIEQVQGLKEKLDFEIGCTNLLRYLKNDGSSYWESRGTCNVAITNEVIRCNANGSSYPRIMNASVKDVNWEPNAQYVLSYYARGEGEYARRVGIVDISAANGVLPLHTDGVYTNDWKKYVYPFTTPSVLPNIDALLLQIYCGEITANDTTSWLEIKDIKLERGNKATDWSPAPEDLITYTDTKIDNIEIGGRNLALNSDVSVNNASYLLYTCSLSEALVQGETYTFTVWGTLGSDRDNFNLYESISSVPQGEVKLVSDGKYVLTFKYNRLSNSDDKILRLYQMPASGTSTSTVQKVKVERGNKATDWSPSPEDVEAKIAFKYLGYDLDLNEFYDNENKSGAVYVNTPDGTEHITNAPEKYGCAVNFGAGVSNFQLFSYAFSNKLYHRNRWWSDNGGEWSDWQQLAYKDDVDTKLPLSGGTLTGDLIAPSFKKNLSSGVAEAVMTHPSSFAEGQDLNSETFLNAGIYRLGSNTGTANQPGGHGYGNVLSVRGYNGDNAAQMFFDYYDNGKAYIRTGSTNPNAAEGFYLAEREWKQLRTMNDLVTTSHIADAAITPAKIQTSIALNGTPSMTVEPTTSSPDKTIASVGLVKKAVDDLDIDTRNLLANSKSITTPVGTTNYTQAIVNVPIGCSVGDVFYFNCDEITNLQGDATQYTILLYDMGNKVSLSADGVITADNRVAKITAWRDADAGNVRLLLYAGLAVDTIGNQVKYTNCTFVKGDKPMLLWQAAPEDIQTAITNAIDYTDAEIDKIENGQTVAQKANSLYDDDSGTYKNWGEIDSAITEKIGDQFDDYATIQYVDNKVASIGTPDNATETAAGIVRAATQAEVNDGHVSDNDPSEMAFVRPETLQSKLSNYPTTTAMTQAINESRQIIYYQSSQPLGGKDGDIWIIP